MTPEYEPPRLVGVQYATEEKWRNISRKNEEVSLSRNSAQLWISLVVKIKSNVVKILHKWFLFCFSDIVLRSSN